MGLESEPVTTSGAGGSAPAPLFSILTAVFDPPEDVFEDTVASVLGQVHGDWEWIVVDDHSSRPGFRERLLALAAAESRVRLLLRG